MKLSSIVTRRGRNRIAMRQSVSPKLLHVSKSTSPTRTWLKAAEITVGRSAGVRASYFFIVKIRGIGKGASYLSGWRCKRAKGQRRDRDLLFASTTMGVTRCRKEVGGEVTNYSSLSAALFLRGNIPPTESRGAGTEFLSSIHHKAAATMLTTSFRHRGRCRHRRRHRRLSSGDRFVLPALKFTTRERSLLSRTRRRSLPAEKQPADSAPLLSLVED